MSVSKPTSTGAAPEDRRELLARLLHERSGQPRSYPVSFAQQRLWFLDQLTPGNPFYNVAIAVRLSVHLEVTVLERCLNEIVRRHEALRTTFGVVDGQPVQIVTVEAKLSLRVVDLRDLPVGKREAEAIRLAKEDAGKPFDLAKGPLLRVTLLWLGAADYLFLLAQHHIVSDGWSMGIFSRELNELYGAFALGRPSPLPEPTLQYSDFAVWQRRWFQGDALGQQLEYWTRTLANPPVLRLATDRPRPPVQSYRGATHTFHTSAALAAALKRLTESVGGTLFITALTAFKALLVRYTRQEDLVVGTYIANRNRAEVEGIIGFFVNTLVLRTDASGEPSFRELLGRVREVALGAYTHQDLPFEMIVERLQPDRDLGRNPLFQIVFQVPTGPAAESGTGSGSATPLLEVKPASAIFDLSVSMWENGSRLTGQLEYSCDLFDESTIERLAAHYLILLEQMAANPDQPITRGSLLTPCEERLLLTEWNRCSAPARILHEVGRSGLGESHLAGTDGRARGLALAATPFGFQGRHEISGPAPDERSVVDLFEEQVARTPDAPAFLCGNDSLSFRELERRACRLAGALGRTSLGPEEPVGVCLERSLDLPVALLAVWMAGGVYLPLDPSYPAERLAWMANEARVQLVITRDSLRVLCPARATVVLVDDEERSPTPERRTPAFSSEGDGLACSGPPPLRHADETTDIASTDANLGPSARIQPDQLAYVIFTSGSTGQPKGVAVEHRQILNRLAWMWQAYPFAPGEVGCQKTALNFVDSFWELLGPLMKGVPTVIVPDDVVRDPWQLVDVLARSGVTRLWLVPSLLRAMLDTSSALAEQLPRLQFWVSTGEILTAELYRRFADQFPEGTLYNLYGTSEVWDVTWFDPRRASAVADSVPIGRPISNLEVYVLDRHLQPTPIGVPGDLWVGGVGLARGYLHRPELTAQKFVAHPFSDRPGARLYQTGDLARFRSDGNLEFLGRLDQQIKIRGYRVEPAEVESVLATHPSVRAVLVTVARDSRTETDALTAYLIPRCGDELGSVDWGAWLATRLPAHLIPASYRVLESLPLLPNGKVDRLAIGRLEAPESAATTPYAPPTTPTEEIMVRIWSGLFWNREVGVHHQFFRDLGGHSLMATQLVSRIRDEFRVELPLRCLFQSPTVSALAAEVDRFRGAPPVEGPALVRLSRDRYRLGAAAEVEAIPKRTPVGDILSPAQTS